MVKALFIILGTSRDQGNNKKMTGWIESVEMPRTVDVSDLGALSRTGGWFR